MNTQKKDEDPSSPQDEEPSGIEALVIESLRQVYDPEIPVNIYDLGLIYKIELSDADEGENLLIEMTLTSANCPMADMIPSMVYDKLVELPDLNKINIKLTFDPPWDKTMMSDEAQVALDIF